MRLARAEAVPIAATNSVVVGADKATHRTAARRRYQSAGIAFRDKGAVAETQANQPAHGTASRADSQRVDGIGPVNPAIVIADQTADVAATRPDSQTATGISIGDRAARFQPANQSADRIVIADRSYRSIGEGLLDIAIAGIAYQSARIRKATTIQRDSGIAVRSDNGNTTIDCTDQSTDLTCALNRPGHEAVLDRKVIALAAGYAANQPANIGCTDDAGVDQVQIADLDRCVAGVDRTKEADIVG